MQLLGVEKREEYIDFIDTFIHSDIKSHSISSSPSSISCFLLLLSPFILSLLYFLSLICYSFLFSTERKRREKEEKKKSPLPIPSYFHPLYFIFSAALAFSLSLSLAWEKGGDDRDRTERGRGRRGIECINIHPSHEM